MKKSCITSCRARRFLMHTSYRFMCTSLQSLHPFLRCRDQKRAQCGTSTIIFLQTLQSFGFLSTCALWLGIPVCPMKKRHSAEKCCVLASSLAKWEPRGTQRPKVHLACKPLSFRICLAHASDLLLQGNFD